MCSRRLLLLIVPVFLFFLVYQSITQAKSITYSTNSQLTSELNSDIANISDWHLESVDTPKLFADMSDRNLKLDSLGYPHIAYGGDHLYYAHFNGTGWITETVDSSVYVGFGASLALDDLDRPHIAYQDYLNGELRYAHLSATGWELQSIDQMATSGFYNYYPESPSIKIDSTGKPHISYCNGSLDYDLRYAHWDGNSWQLSTIMEKGDNSSLALDTSDRPHISFIDIEDNELKYAHWTGSNWNVQTIDEFAERGATSITLNSQSEPYIAYSSEYENLSHAYWNGSEWIVEQVSYLFDYGDSISIGLDAAENPHIVSGGNYFQWTGSEWMIDYDYPGGIYASIAFDELGYPQVSFLSDYNLIFSTRGDEGWNTEIVDTAGELQSSISSLAVDSNGNPHIAYYDYAESMVMYAYYENGNWQIESVAPASVGLSHRDLVLKLDSYNKPHISYYYDNQIYYARWTGSQWLTEALDYDGSVFHSLDLDEYDQPHIVYKSSSGHLKYAYWNGSQWLIDTVAGGSGSGYISLALDSVGAPHLAFSDFSNQRLVYTTLAGNEWYSDTIASGFVSHNVLELDDNNEGHILFISDLEDAIKYAYESEGTWHITTVTTTRASGISLSLSQVNRPHISYCDRSLYQGALVGNNWQIKAIPETWDCSGSSISLSDVGTFIAYFDRLHNGLMLANRQNKFVFLPVIIK